MYRREGKQMRYTGEMELSKQKYNLKSTANQGLAVLITRV